MFVLGHMGIGSRLASPFLGDLSRPTLPLKWFFMGSVLPDFIDKPLYYSLVLLTGKTGAALGLISGTRTFGHTALFLLAVTLISCVRRSPILAALALGIASHLLLDHLGDIVRGPLLGLKPPANFWTAEPDRITGFLWPLLGWKFYVIKYDTAVEHAEAMLFKPDVLFGELAGLILLFPYLLERWRNRRHR